MKSIEKFFNMSMGIYSGVLIREKTAKKLAKMLYKQTQEIKELLASDLSQLEVSDWTLAYPNNDQTRVRYYSPSNDSDKLHRINLIDKEKLIEYVSDVFIADNMKDAENKFIEWFEKTNREVGE